MVYAVVATPPGTGQLGWVWDLVNVLQGVLFFLLGDLNLQLAYLGLVVVLDTGLGICVAKRIGSFSLGTFAKKTLEKIVIYLIIIVLSNALDVVIMTPRTFRWLAILGLLVQEIFSSINHIESLGYKNLATTLKKILADQAIPAIARLVVRGDVDKRGDKR